MIVVSTDCYQISRVSFSDPSDLTVMTYIVVGEGVEGVVVMVVVIDIFLSFCILHTQGM